MASVYLKLQVQGCSVHVEQFVPAERRTPPVSAGTNSLEKKQQRATDKQNQNRVNTKGICTVHSALIHLTGLKKKKKKKKKK